MEWESGDAEKIMSELSGAQVLRVQIDGPNGIHIHFLDERVLVVVGLPALGIAIIQPDRSLQ